MVVVVDEVVVVHGHAGCAMLPTATFKHRRASVDVTGGAPLSSQMHSGSQAPIPTATFNMNRQSLATEPVPVLTGWPQSPWPASAAAGLPIESARTRNIAEMAVMGRACHNSKTYFYAQRVGMQSARNFFARITLSVVFTALFIALPYGTAPAAEFRGLGVGAGTDEATAVSGDGTVVIGRNVTGTLGYRWSESDGVQYVGFYPDDASFDGNVIVGTLGFYEAARWTQATGMVRMDDLTPGDGSIDSLALAVSADGSVIVGATAGAPFRWTAPSGPMTASPTIAEDSYNGKNIGVSADGSVTAGVYTTYGTSPGTYYFRAENGAVTDDLSGLLLGASASGVSADGNVVFGQRTVSDSGVAAFWSNGVITDIGGLPGFTLSYVEGGSATGDCFAGSSWDDTTYEAMIWDDLNGVRRVRDVLEDDFGLGADLTGWTLTHAVDVDDDCTTIVGTGIDPNGHSQAWIITGFSKTGVQTACSQPTSSGPKPVASDCLFILNVAVGTQVCPLECVCAPKGTLPASATDALMCLQSAVGQTVPLSCPCPN